MATKFPKFSQAPQDPATRRICMVSTAHDLEAHDGMTEENLYQKIFFTLRSFSNYFLWTAGIYSMLLGKEILKMGR
jgi:photosystem I P700 chlorophyll a apoprotein A2